ncbi:hypothetical protein JL721_7500 [Aureococcus anophagefferens]|nr:hypothetical protein JL721_7500 [Aureococcus anophagefferens]
MLKQQVDYAAAPPDAAGAVEPLVEKAAAEKATFPYMSTMFSMEDKAAKAKADADRARARADAVEARRRAWEAWLVGAYENLAAVQSEAFADFFEDGDGAGEGLYGRGEAQGSGDAAIARAARTRRLVAEANAAAVTKEREALKATLREREAAIAALLGESELESAKESRAVAALRERRSAHESFVEEQTLESDRRAEKAAFEAKSDLLERAVDAAAASHRAAAERMGAAEEASLARGSAAARRAAAAAHEATRALEAWTNLERGELPRGGRDKDQAAKTRGADRLAAEHRRASRRARRCSPSRRRGAATRPPPSTRSPSSVFDDDADARRRPRQRAETGGPEDVSEPPPQQLPDATTGRMPSRAGSAPGHRLVSTYASAAAAIDDELARSRKEDARLERLLANELENAVSGESALTRVHVGSLKRRDELKAARRPRAATSRRREAAREATAGDLEEASDAQSRARDVLGAAEADLKAAQGALKDHAASTHGTKLRHALDADEHVLARHESAKFSVADALAAAGDDIKIDGLKCLPHVLDLAKNEIILVDDQIDGHEAKKAALRKDIADVHADWETESVSLRAKLHGAECQLKLLSDDARAAEMVQRDILETGHLSGRSPALPLFRLRSGRQQGALPP